MNAPVEPAGTRSDCGLRAAVVLCATVIVLTALYFTGSVFAPPAFAMLIIAVMWPLQARLQARLPKLVALFLTMVATVVILSAFVSLVAWGSGGAETAAELRRYMWVRTLMSVLTGALVSLFALAVGLPLAAEWGVIAFALNYIPFIGSFIATLFPTLFAIAQFPSWQTAVVVFACVNFIQFLVGSYLEPRLAGCRSRRSWCYSRCSSGPSCGGSPAPSSACRS
jgi:predicted PurR-regulated permease PerM